MQPNDVNVDMIVDAALLLWNKCKAMLNRYQSPVITFPKCLARIDNVGKVSNILWFLFTSFCMYLLFLTFLFIFIWCFGTLM